MKVFEKILVPTDFSPRSEAGLNYALDLALRMGSEILLFNVIREPYGFASQVDEYKINMQDFAISWMQDKIKEIHNRKKFANLNIKASVSFGRVVTQLISESREYDADVIILSNDGGVKGNSYLGSIVSDLIQFSEIPVISVPHDIKKIQWNDLVFATDYNKGDIEAIKFLSDMAKHLKSDIHIVHVDEEQKLKNEIMFLGFEQKVKDSLGSYELSFEDVYGDDFIEGISQYLENEPCSLLILSRNKGSSFRRLIDNSIASTVSLQAKTPVMVWVSGDR